MEYLHNFFSGWTNPFLEKKQMLAFWASFPSLPFLFTGSEKAQELAAQKL